MPILPYREPEIIPSCAGLGDVCQKENLRRAEKEANPLYPVPFRIAQLKKLYEALIHIFLR